MRGRRKVPAEEFVVAVFLGPGQEVEDDGKGVGDVSPASGVVEVAAEPADGGESKAGICDALDDVSGVGEFAGSPVVGDGFGDAAGFDDGEFGGRTCA